MNKSPMAKLLGISFADLSVEELRQLLVHGTMEGQLPIGKDAAFAASKEYAENYPDVTVTGGEAKPELDEWCYMAELSLSTGH